MKISIIIPAFNEIKDIENCVETLERQTLDDFEIIVVDDGSTDGTIDLLKKLKKSYKNFRFIRKNHLGAGAARNAGAKLSKSEILVFVDADMTFEKYFLQNLTAPIIEGKVKGTFSKEEYVDNWDNNWAKCWNINENWEPKHRHPKNYPDRQPVFRAILKNEFDRVGGFTPGGYDDDWSLSRKLGYEAVNAPAAIFYHKNPATLNEVYKQAKWVGKRKYKFGILGYIVGMVRATLPVSIIIGLFKSFTFHFLPFTLFKLVYDFGIIVGIFELLTKGKSSK
jgi:glycosyltransferase involved in cell wall biosynthesis